MCTKCPVYPYEISYKKVIQNNPDDRRFKNQKEPRRY